MANGGVPMDYMTDHDVIRNGPIWCGFGLRANIVTPLSLDLKQLMYLLLKRQKNTHNYSDRR